MNEQQFHRLIEKLDKEIIRSNQVTRTRRFQGVNLIKAEPTDNAETSSLIADHNHKARSYNRLGGEMGRMLQKAIDENAPRVCPQDDLLGVIDEWLRLRSKRNESLLHGVEPRLHLLESSMKNTLHGPNGIRDLVARISDSRGN